MSVDTQIVIAVDVEGIVRIVAGIVGVFVLFCSRNYACGQLGIRNLLLSAVGLVGKILLLVGVFRNYRPPFKRL